MLFLGLSPSLWRIVVDYTTTLVRNKPSYGWTGAMCRFMHDRVHHTWPLPKEEQEEDFLQLLVEARDWSQQQQQQSLSTCRELDWWMDGLDLARHSVYSVDIYGGRAGPHDKPAVFLNHIWIDRLDNRVLLLGAIMARAYKFAQFLLDCYSPSVHVQILCNVFYAYLWPNKVNSSPPSLIHHLLGPLLSNQGESVEEKTALDWMFQHWPKDKKLTIDYVPSSLSQNVAVLRCILARHEFNRSVFTDRFFRDNKPAVHQLEQLYQALPDLLSPACLVNRIGHHPFSLCRGDFELYGLSEHNLRWLLQTFPEFQIAYEWLPFFPGLMEQDPVLNIHQVVTLRYPLADDELSELYYSAASGGDSEKAKSLRNLVQQWYASAHRRGQKRVRDEEDSKEESNKCPKN